MGSLIRTFASAEGAEHENTTDEGSIAKHTFTADSLQAGKVFDFRCAIVVNDNNSTDTATLAVRFGSSTTVTSNTACGTSNAIDVADADLAVITGHVACHTATRAVVYGLISAPDAANVQAAYPFYTVVTIAAGTTYYLDITADWSVAHADNELAAADFHVIEHTQ